MRTAFIETLCELAEQDARIWLLTGDLGYSVIEPFVQRFPERYINVGVAEQNMTGIAAGIALSGGIVLTYSIANFPILRCLEQVRNDICYHHANVKIVAVGGGLTYGSHGYTHHGVEDLAIMRVLPNMTVIAPGDPVEARLATRAMINSHGPCYLRLGKAGEALVHQQEPAFELGKAIIARPGQDLALVSTGAVLPLVMEAAALLAEQGRAPRVLSMHTLKPFDSESVVLAARTCGGIITVEEHSKLGGLGSAVCEALADADVSGVRVRRLGIPDVILTQAGSQLYLRKQAGITCEQILKAAADL